MKLFEMEGFLRGKCIPGDMLVNETNAQYLVRKISGLEAQVKQLAAERDAVVAENAALKNLARGWANATDDRLFEEHGEVFHDSIEDCEAELKTICPATDAYAASLRAEGVEMFAKHIFTITGALEIHDQYGADFCRDEAESFAAQLRSKSEVQS